MRRVLILVVFTLGLAGCLPQLGVNPLTIAVTGAQTATVTFSPPEEAHTIVLYVGGAQRVLSAAPELTCAAFETGWQCLADALSGPVAVTVFADPLADASAQVWWSVPGTPVNIARVDLQ